MLSEIGGFQNSSSGLINEVFTRINHVIETNSQESLEDGGDESSSESLICAEMEESKESAELSLSIIKNKAATGSE